MPATPEFDFGLGEHAAMIRQSTRRFAEDRIAPLAARIDADDWFPREIWPEMGALGLHGITVEEDWGGLGLGYLEHTIAVEEISRASASIGLSYGAHSNLCINQIRRWGNPEQKAKYLPKMISGEVITAIAMTEPGAGSDLQGIKTTARKDGNHYVINGSKTYITNGQNADLIIVVAKTDPEKGAKGTSLILVEADREGFARGRNLDKIGQNSADTSELFFNDVRVPMTNCLGEENKGFIYLMSQLPQERLSIAISAQAGAQRAFDEAVKFVKERKAFGKTVWEFQNTQFVLAGLKTELQVGWAHIDWGLQKLIEGKLTDAEASAAKLWHTELQGRVCDEALQLHGGAGYMNEYPIARLWRDARVQRIYGGTSEIMKLVVSRTI